MSTLGWVALVLAALAAAVVVWVVRRGSRGPADAPRTVADLVRLRAEQAPSDASARAVEPASDVVEPEPVVAVVPAPVAVAPVAVVPAAAPPAVAPPAVAPPAVALPAVALPAVAPAATPSAAASPAAASPAEAPEAVPASAEDTPWNRAARIAESRGVVWATAVDPRPDPANDLDTVDHEERATAPDRVGAEAAARPEPVLRPLQLPPLPPDLVGTRSVVPTAVVGGSTRSVAALAGSAMSGSLIPGSLIPELLIAGSGIAGSGIGESGSGGSGSGSAEPGSGEFGSGPSEVGGGERGSRPVRTDAPRLELVRARAPRCEVEPVRNGSVSSSEPQPAEAGAVVSVAAVSVAGMSEAGVSVPGASLAGMVGGRWSAAGGSAAAESVVGRAAGGPAVGGPAVGGLAVGGLAVGGLAVGGLAAEPAPPVGPTEPSRPSSPEPLRARRTPAQTAAEQAAADLALLRTFGATTSGDPEDEPAEVALEGVTVAPALPEPSDGQGRPVGFHVIGRDGAGVPGAGVTLLDDRGREAAGAVADAAGRGSVVAPRPGSYVLVSAAADHQPGAVAITVADEPVTAEILLARSASLAGTVHGEDGPVVGALLTLLQDGEIVDSARTGPGGGYRIADLAAGEYRLSVTATECEPAAVVVTVPEETDLRCDVELDPEGLTRPADGLMIGHG